MIRFKNGGIADGNFDANLLGNPNDNWIMNGAGGADVLRGGNKADLLLGGSGNDLLFGGGGKDALYGDAGADILDGGGGNDALFGGADADMVIGGLGRDLLSGGSGADIFDFNAISESGNAIATADVIADFTEGADKFDLSDVAGVFGYSGPELNTGVGPHSVFWSHSGGNTIMEVNATFDTTSDMRIVLTGLHTLTAADFLFSPI